MPTPPPKPAPPSTPLPAGQPLAFEIEAKSASTSARVGRVTTPHGSFQTPAFMTVGTKATVKGIYPAQLRAVGAEVLLANTYHLLLRPGPDTARALGGLHAMMGWDGPILTDSGGYQAYSMADINAVDDQGVTFKSVVDGAMIRMTPESSMQIQNALGADIIMAFDDCPPSIDPSAGPVNQTRIRLAQQRDAQGPGSYNHAARLQAANERTVRWLERCVRAHERHADQALFGIVQGGTDPDRRAWCAEQIAAIDLPGYAIGGVAVGELTADIRRVTELTAALLPEAKPRYLMGVGYEHDIVSAVRAGVDMFDCVLPTRNGRNANAFTRSGQIRLRNARFAEDLRPLEEGCDCPACDPSQHGVVSPGGGPMSRGTIRHLFHAQEMLGPILVSLHNLRHFQRLMDDLRQTIRSDQWDGPGGFYDRWPVASEAFDGGSGARRQAPEA